MAVWSASRVAALVLGMSLWALRASAEIGYLAHGDGEGFKCAGVYGSPNKLQGRRSAIEVEIPPEPPSDITIAIFNYPDSKWIGIPVKEGTKLPDEAIDMPATYINSDRDPENTDQEAGVQRFSVCANETIAMGLCSEIDRGRPLINDRDNDGKPRSFTSVVYADYIMLSRSGTGSTRLEYKAWLDAHNGTDPHDDSWKSKARSSVIDGTTIEWTADGTLKLRYLVNTTGFYCVDAASTGDFTARAEWTNSYGLLPASEYPKMYVYLLLMIAYAGIAIAWAFMSWRVWSEILPVQNQLLGLTCLLAVDMGMNFGFWKHYNTTGTPSMVYSIFTLIIDAGRNSLSFFMLLVVALGWGVVRPSLGKTMIRCILLAIVHFSAGCLYSAGILFRDPHDQEPLGLIYVIPLSLSMTMFYTWTLSAIINTTHVLIERQQSYKLSMYNKLWRLLVVCLLLLLVFFIFDVLHTVFYERLSVAARSWKWRWFWTDGWLNFEYFVAIAIILYWWRPTSQNYRYSLEEIASDEVDAMAREHVGNGNDSFDNPRMGEDLELAEFDLSAAKRDNRKASFSGDDVQFVINNDEVDFSSDSDEEQHTRTSPPSTAFAESSASSAQQQDKTHTA
ncbi:hypothetical protein LPJ53_003810 [Coemansia erecta]|uniref:GOST seven transmembrane domain-containing protein n=1 Tax=Coemansia erecta TaxID=147472 RepID=A0A9W7XZV3_9FUNG|nr:hypothetical protein LPJ53_003810 [Coemansia erecta]